MLFQRMGIYFHIFLLPTTVRNYVAEPRTTGWEHPFTVQDSDNPQNSAPPRSPQKESAYAPQGLLLQRVYPGVNKQDTLSQAQEQKCWRPGQCSLPAQSTARATASRYLQETQRGNPQRGKLCRKGRALGLICYSTFTPSPAFSYIPKSLHKKGGGWMSCLQTPVQAIPSVS